MITPELFDRLMRAFGSRIGKALGADAGAMYYAILSAELTDDEFQRGMLATMRNHEFNTWPAPAAIIAAAKPSVELTAASAWTQLTEALKRRDPSTPAVQSLRLMGVDETAIATFLTIGGIGRWRAANDFRFDQMRDEFLESYGDMQRLAPAQQAALSGLPSPSPKLPASGSTPVRQILAGIAPYSPGDNTP